MSEPCSRPPHSEYPDGVPDGYAWTAVPEDIDGLLAWRVDTEDEVRGCRQMHCKAASVARLNRRKRERGSGQTVDSWWHYCAEHLYGRWIENGKVMHWVLRPVVDEPPQMRNDVTRAHEQNQALNGN